MCAFGYNSTYYVLGWFASSKAVQDLQVDEELRLASGGNARVTHASPVRQAMQDLVELVTNQASLRVPLPDNLNSQCCNPMQMKK
jgi:hypothetical protein